jgi:choline dehydrogenase
MLSGVGPAEHLKSLGIEVVHDLPGVGQNLRDHPMGVLLFREAGAMPGELDAMVQVLLRYTAEGSRTRNDMQIFHLPLDCAYRAYLPANLPIASNDNYFALCVGLQNALSSGEIRLTSKDPRVHPSINHRYLSDPWDRERMRQGVRLAIRLSQHPAFKDVILECVSPANADLVSDEALDAWLLRNLDTLYHTSGTCKMGPASDPLAVVDQFCHVRRLEGLRVVDTSVMPDVIRANTNATAIMIAERVADWMKAGQ